MRFRFFTFLLFAFIFSNGLGAQDISLSGQIVDDKRIGVPFATIIMRSSTDSVMIKADITGDDGKYSFNKVKNGSYYMEASFVGMMTYYSQVINIDNSSTILEPIILLENAKQLEEVTVTAQRALIEVKADRTVFNVQGTINSAGDNGLNLLKKAPGVMVDNNNNVSVLGRSGVLFYVDGKRIPLSGDDLTNYLENLTSEQIDKIDIITNPGSKYEAQGNAGIIDIRLKKDKNLGANGSISSNYSQGKYGTGNASANGNYRNKNLNSFGTVGYNAGTRWNEMLFSNDQNGLRMDESNYSTNDYNGVNGRLGTDFFISKNSTLGFLVGVQSNQSNNRSKNLNYISRLSNPEKIDSILSAPNTSESDRNQATFNINYAYSSGNKRLNIDADYGRFRNRSYYDQPNYYFNPENTIITSQIINSYDTPVDIDISTFKVDYETEGLGGNIGIGTKLSNVATNNSFLFFNVVNGAEVKNNTRSNIFDYDENVFAGYINYSRNLSKKWTMSAGLRAEHTDATGDLTAFLPELEEEPVDFKYTSFFPSAGLTYTLTPEHVYSLNYGRRINRPDYNILNPFKEQLSELSYSRGNKFLQPEIVNNIELGYILKYRYSFKLAYSNTTNQITRLIGPDAEDPRAGFISWDNLATQKLYSLSISAPIDVTKWWNMYANINANYTNNQACLLYTSPSPRDGLLSRMPSSA